MLTRSSSIGCVGAELRLASMYVCAIVAFGKGWVGASVAIERTRHLWPARDAGW